MIGKKKNRLERELPVAKVEQILKRRAQQIDDHGIVIALRPEPAHEGNSDAASERFINLRLVFELRVLGLNGFQFDGDFLS